MNENLESIIETYDREKTRLELEVKRYTKGKGRSGMIEAELHRKMSQNGIVKRAYGVSNAMFKGVKTEKSQ